MSYGIWRKRGKGWCSIEIDSPGGGLSDSETLRGYRHTSEDRGWGWYLILLRGLDRHEILYDDLSDYHQLEWRLNQAKNQPKRTVSVYYPGAGEHVRWISHDNDEALVRAMDAVDASKEDRDDVRVDKA